jgi:hypothetical protein
MSEPSFFDGAMYISYAMQVALIITIFVALNIFGIAELWLIITLCVSLSLLMIPLTFRLSRSAYINLFVKYDPKKRTEFE